MKCWHHPAEDAVGVCRHCGRGLCPECAVELERWLACRGRCEGKVAEARYLLRTRRIRMRRVKTKPPGPPSPAARTIRWLLLAALFVSPVVLAHLRSTAKVSLFVDAGCLATAVTLWLAHLFNHGRHAG